jgi:UDP-N-acetylmuramoyl-tripeptide--D-alanyl-D-alanine ligase
MAELGEEGPRLHAEIGELARACGVTRLFALGAGSKPAVATFGEGGEWFASADDLIAALRPGLRSGLTVYIKGSRVNRLERVTSALLPPGAAMAEKH